MRFNKLGRTIAALAAIGIAVVSTGFALAQDYPSQPVRIIHPGAAGGGADALARVLGDALAKRLGGQFLAEARPGAGTILAAQTVASAPSDGARLLMSSVSTMAATPWLYKTLPYDVTKSFASIARLTSSPNVFVASNKLPVTSMRELIEYAKSYPGKLNYGTIGQGTTSHLVGVAVVKAAGLNATNVPFKGTADMLLAVMPGDVQLAAQDVGGLVGQIKSGAVRALAITGERRSVDFPDIPTMKDLGMDSANLSVWYGLEAPAGTSPAIVAKLSAAVGDAMKDPEVIERYRRLGAEPAYMPTAEYLAFRLAELERYRVIVAASGATIQ